MTKHYDAVVVGGGPSGAAVARRIAQAGFRVAILEQHPRVGSPVQCSGLVTSRTLREANLDPSIAFNALTGARIVSPNGSAYDIGGDRIYAYILDRQQFDQLLAEQALEAGVDQWLDTRVVNLEFEGSGVRLTAGRNGTLRSFHARLVIGADGPRSVVASFLQLPPPAEVVRARGADVRLPRRPPADQVHIFAGERYGPAFFAWIIPIDGDRYRIGWGFGRPDTPANPLRALVEDYPEIFEGLQILSQTGGLIPLGARSRMSGMRGLVVGDAAGQAKATSGGGLYTSLVSARHCADAAIAALSADDTSAEQLCLYDKSWRTGIGRELARATALRAAYRRLTDGELEWALQMLRFPGMRHVVDRHGDIDFPSGLATNALRIAPGLLRLLVNKSSLPGFQLDTSDVSSDVADSRSSAQ